MRKRLLSRTHGFLFTALLLALALPASAQKKPLDHDAYDIWNRITGQSLTDDGRWALYGVVSEKYDPTVIVRSTSSETEHRLERAEAGQFSHDGRFVVFRIKPSKAAVEEAKKAKKKPDEMPQDSMGILDLTNGQMVRVERVKSFKLPDDNGQWLAYQLLKPPAAKPDSTKPAEARPAGARPAAGAAATDSAKTPEKKKEDGTVLVLRNLTNGMERRIEFVTDYAFAKDGGKLVYLTSTKDGSGDGAYALAPGGGQATALLTGKGDYKSIAIDEAGAQVAFLSNRNDYAAEQPAFEAYWWDGKAAEAKPLVTAATAGVPQDWWVSENRAPSFSRNGQRLFVGTAPRPAPEVKDTTPADEKVAVDIWAWTDPLLQPMQLKQVDQEKRRNYEGVVDLKSGKYVQLATLDVPDVTVAARGDGNLVLGRSNLPYRQEISWGESGNDLYLVDIGTGAARKVLEHVVGSSGISPMGKYLYWFDGDAKQWQVMDVATGKTVDVSSAIGEPVNNELQDTPDTPRPYGSAGWTDNDAQFLVYDRDDVWALDPTGKAAPRNITNGVGRRDNLRFRIVDLDRERQSVDANGDLLFSAFNYWTKQSGFYRDRVRGDGAPVKLVMDDVSYGGGFGGGVTKAADADLVMFTKGSFETFPDLYVSDLSMASPRRISDANPQQKDYLWGTSELVQWRSAMDGEMLQGILYKPENFDPSKKYPMMVYFYERLSDNLHGYVTPAAGSSSINISFYVSRGYLVFTPDIPYRIGYPGESALKAVVPGVLSLIDTGFIDADNIGVQGHSWGGYQIGYLVTKTNIFKAAEAGAPVSDMISAYGGIRWGTGMSRMFQYEHTQSRIGGTLWEAPIHYIENSPIFWVDKVETPLLMMHNDADGAVPWYQGIEYFVALRRLQKPAWLVVYNGEDHGLRKAQNRKDWTIRLQQFFDYYLKGAPEPVWMAEGVPAIMKGKTLGLELVTDKKPTTNEQGGGK